MSKQRLFEVGDKVRSHLWEGVATVVENRHKEGSHIITIKNPTSSDIYHSFYSNGLRYGEYEPSLRHAETGSPCVVGEPPERFEYPLYMESKYGLIVKFTALCTATVMRARPDSFCDGVGVCSADYSKHTNRNTWTPCDKPKWKPTKPTWCWVWDAYRADAMRRLVRPNNLGDMTDLYYVIPGDYQIYHKHAEPCEAKDIPDYWPESWK